MPIGLTVPQMPGMRRIDAERRARAIVLAFRPEIWDHPQSFPSAEFFEFHCVERYKLNTGTADLPFGIEGVTRPNGCIRIAASVYDDMLDDLTGRSRFTPIHEAVHGIVHLPTLRRLQVELVEGASPNPRLYRREELPSFADPEWQANRIAGAMLMPVAAVQAVVARYGRDIRAIMDTFKVSHAAAETRLSQLDQLGWLS
jgi:hypothetical protein